MHGDRTLRPLLDVETSSENGCTRVALAGQLDLSTVERLDGALERAQAPGERALLLDLSRLSFLDSTGLKAILRAQRRAAAAAGSLRIVPGPEPVQQVFRVTGLAGHLDFVA